MAAKIRILLLILVTYISILFSNPLSIDSNWVIQNPFPSDSWYFTIETIGEDTVFIGGMGGTLVSSYDGGDNWDMDKFSDLVDVRDISFIDDQKGLFIDSDHIYKTINGGVSWYDINNDFDLETYFFNYLSCQDDVIYLILKPRTSYIYDLIDAQTHLYKSEDEGSTWQRVDVTMNGRELCAFFKDKDNGYIYVEETVSIDEGYNCLYQTHDGGENWIKNTYSDIYFARGMHFLNDDIGFIGRNKTYDGGNTWTDVFNDILVEYENIDGYAFKDSLNGWAICSNSIYKTFDGGDTWVKDEQYATHALYDIELTSNGTGWIAGLGCNIYKKGNSTDYWNKITNGTTNDLKDIDFINDMVGWCVGNNGTILYTENGGDNWVQQNSPVDSNLFSVKFLDEETGWAVGDNIVLYTVNSGEQWNIKENLSGYFIDVDYFDEKNWLIVDYNGKVYKTSNGGTTWSRTASIPHVLRCLEIMSADKALIGGAFGLAFASNKGNIVQWYDTPRLLNIRQIQFIDENTGYLRNDGSEIFYTEDEGQNWSLLNTEALLADAMYMFYNNMGWIFDIRSGGYLHKIQINNSDVELYGSDMYKVAKIQKILFTKEDCGWAIGSGGIILKYGKSSIPIIDSDSSVVLIYPNPNSNHLCYVEFYLNSYQTVHINLYDINGRLVKVITDDAMIAGDNRTSFNTKNLSSGIYVLLFRVGNYSESKKVILLK